MAGDRHGQGGQSEAGGGSGKGGGSLGPPGTSPGVRCSRSRVSAGSVTGSCRGGGLGRYRVRPLPH